MTWLFELRWPWVAAGLAVVVLLLLLRWSRPAKPPKDGLLVAHLERLRRLPRYRTLARRELVAATVCAAGALVLVTGAMLVASRPERVEVVQPERAGRDVMLCLDASESMERWNSDVVRAFRRLVSGLEGDRLGLMIFSGAAVAVFPLTDDYEFVRDRLEEAERAFEAGDFRYFTGVEYSAGASQVGDGITSCVQRLGRRDDKRGRAVVVASDNEPVGTPVLTLPEAARVANRNGVVLYGIGTPDLLRRPESEQPFRAAMETTGGTLSIVQQGTAGPIIEGIQELEEARAAARPTEVARDNSRNAFALSLLGLTGLLVGALLRRRS